ncbi:hypothetical protein BV898_10336 [Hypsibius exemplaris]|uniref:Uncharacterized protein n=1 Tax=Hypsibius exemplaris TaxID=2072580 RepID=A0A1W0WJR4_HYPEX|nr:hypothetical protein BV898_10336 [Hypsibius exemplaris]
MEYKVVVVGEDCPTKSWIAQQMTHDTSWIEESLVELCPYRKGYVAENQITEEAFRNQIPIKLESETLRYTVKIVDTTGLEDTYPGIYEKHLRTADGFCLVFDPDNHNENTTEEIDLIWEEIRLIRKSRKFPLLFLSHSSYGSREQTAGQARFLRNLTRRYGAPVKETSSEETFSVQEAFRGLMKEIRKQPPKKTKLEIVARNKSARAKEHCRIA